MTELACLSGHNGRQHRDLHSSAWYLRGRMRFLSPGSLFKLVRFGAPHEALWPVASEPMAVLLRSCVYCGACARANFDGRSCNGEPGAACGDRSSSKVLRTMIPLTPEFHLVNYRSKCERGWRCWDPGLKLAKTATPSKT